MLRNIEGGHAVDGAKIRGDSRNVHMRIAKARHERAATDVELSCVGAGSAVSDRGDPAIADFHEAIVEVGTGIDVENARV
ncbi:hypothetical protein [Rhizobium sp. BK376]|uniref:hypothetical protein n=1 Tax=Rhizobium sp. BK376 TaxID=2512149 RepID=UPI001FDFA229|nr:hypothetical protein [Rhizobium sp. BK376]